MGEGMVSKPTEASPLVGSRAAGRSLGYWQLCRLLLPVFLGNVLEFYEYASYASLTEEISANMFASDDVIGRRYSIWVAFIVGQAVRPFGGGFFGCIGQRFGKRTSIIASTAGMLGSTFLLGCIPTRRSCGPTCGHVGSALVIVLRMCQGLCAAGEVAIGTTYVIEKAGPSRCGFGLGLMNATGTAGFLLSSAVASVLETTLSQEHMLAWGWRLPFLLGVPLGIPILYLQRSLEESSDSSSDCHHGLQEATPTPGAVESGTAGLGAPKREGGEGEVPSGGCFGGFSGSSSWLASYSARVLQSAVIAGTSTGFMYGVPTYLKDLLVVESILPIQQASYAAITTYAVMCASLILSGFLIDHLSLQTLVEYALPVFLVVIIPYGLLATTTIGSPWTNFLGAGLLGSYAVVSVATNMLTYLLFPPSIRAVGGGVGHNLGVCLFGGPAPFVDSLVLQELSKTALPIGLVHMLSLCTWAYVCIAFGGVMLYLVVRDAVNGEPWIEHAQPYTLGGIECQKNAQKAEADGGGTSGDGRRLRRAALAVVAALAFVAALDLAIRAVLGRSILFSVFSTPTGAGAAVRAPKHPYDAAFR